MSFLDSVYKKLIVSCQALENEPLHYPYIMGKMALAAKQGGASGIRANTVEDIREIKREVNLPIIGIVKRDFDNSEVFITPTTEEVDALYREGVDMIAVDATNRSRPGGESFQEFFSQIKNKYPDQLFMGDVSTLEEGLMAEAIGVDVIATTLAGYTSYSKEVQPLELVKKLSARLKVPLIAEGNIDTPEKAKQALEYGAHAVVVGSAITRPQLITERFATKVNECNGNHMEIKEDSQ